MNLKYLGDLVYLSVGINKKEEQEARSITGMKRNVKKKHIEIFLVFPF